LSIFAIYIHTHTHKRGGWLKIRIHILNHRNYLSTAALRLIKSGAAKI